jgi:hypothetical protein
VVDVSVGVGAPLAVRWYPAGTPPTLGSFTQCLMLAMRSLVHCGYRGHGDGHELWSDSAFHAHDSGSVVPVCTGSVVVRLSLTASVSVSIAGKQWGQL